MTEQLRHPLSPEPLTPEWKIAKAGAMLTDSKTLLETMSDSDAKAFAEKLKLLAENFLNKKE